MSRSMSFNLPASSGSTALGLPSPNLIVTDGPHRLVGTTPIPAIPGTMAPGTHSSARAKQSPVELGEWENDGFVKDLPQK